MRRLHYHRVDVFTDRAFGGNPLAVCTNGRGLNVETMQAIAKEFNLSETTFVLPPDDPKHDWRVRIFTPGRELPMKMRTRQRSEEHTSELQSLAYLVCRLLLEKKKAIAVFIVYIEQLIIMTSFDHSY